MAMACLRADVDSHRPIKERQRFGLSMTQCERRRWRLNCHWLQLALPGVVLPTPVLPLRATTSATPIITAGVSAVLPPVISPTRGGGRGAARGGVSRCGTTRGSGRVTFAGQVATIITVAPSPPMIRGGRGRGRAAAVVSSVITRGGRVSRGRK